MKKKVLHLLCFPLWGSGSGTYARELALESNKDKNTEVAIVCPEAQEKIPELKIYPLDMSFPVAFTGHPDWPHCRLYKDLSSREITDVFRAFLVSTVRAIEDFHPNIIHVHHASIFLWVANYIKLLYGINFIVTVHGTCIAAAEQNKVYIAPSQDALKRAKKILPVSGDTKSWLINVFGVEFAEKSRIMPGGTHLNMFSNNGKIKIINEKYGLDGKKVVLFSGKLTEPKGVYYLVKAAKNIDGDVYIIGDGPDKKTFEDIIVKRGLKNVHLLGYMGEDKKQELHEFYCRADVFVAPSVWDEPLGLVILEAMSCKTPIIATRKGGIPLAVKDGVNGFLIKPRNSTQIAEACNKLLKDDKLNYKMGEAARQTVEQNFTWDKIADKHSRIYERYGIIKSKNKKQ
ncbi:MAG: Spore coat protein SA [Parcubacteria group bacterium ADurb.Bin247]|jgi:glycosyltransferase involved in cell wall biosynthesis|nr:MAG: Spore coat protein SA [Parcubacteria group bacterium ADurb.Bin247]HQB85215.1 glycosyltransferase family 4 protein [Candidatus Pacearchaeota archaeon]